MSSTRRSSRPLLGNQTPFRWGHLRVLEPLGSGGFGEIFRAYDPKLDREVALKLRRGRRGSTASYLEEARRLAKIRHPNVLTIHGVDQHEGRIGLWTELIDGHTLESLLERSGPMGSREATLLGIDLCRALAAVHGAGLLHRDIKTSNVMRETGGRTVLMDFGTVTDSGEEGSGSLVGTPLAMAPELFQGAPPAQATDLYSLGVLLYRMTAGGYPYEAASLGELEDLIDDGRFVSLRDRRPELEGEFIAVVEAALAKEPGDRYSSAGDFERALAETLTDRPRRDRRRTRSAVADAGSPDYDQLVGRAPEVGVLQAELDATLRGVGQTVLVSGEPGVGKTQLARHFGRWASEEGDFRVLTTRFFDYEGSRIVSYEAFLDLLAELLDLPTDVPRATKRKRTAELVAREIGLQLPAELFEGQGPGEQSGDDYKLVAPLAEAFLGLSVKRPLVLVLDDLQWADPGSLEILGYLMRTQAGEPLMILGLYRNEDSQRGTLGAWLRRQAGYRAFTTLTLRPLSAQDFGNTVERVFGGELVLPDADLKTLHESTGGNPYFLAEMLRLLVAEGRASRGRDGHWSWSGLGRLHLPESLVMAAKDKLDRLPSGVRTVLEAAAVIGEEFRVPTLSRITGADDDELDRSLDPALEAGVVSAEGISLGEDYRFYHTILRRVLYESLRPRRRRRLHEAAAHALEANYPEELDRFAESISVHHESAGNLRRGLEWSLTAWRAARARSQWSTGLRNLDRVLRIFEQLEAMGFETEAEQRLETLSGKGQALLAVGRLNEAKRNLQRAQRLAERLGDSRATAACSLDRGRVHAGSGEYARASELFEHASEIFERLGETELVQTCLVERASVGAAQGDHELVETLAKRVLDEGEADSAATADAAGLLGWSLALRGRSDDGIRLLGRALEHYERKTDLRQRALFVRRLHWVHMMRGNYEESIRLAHHAHDLSLQVDDAWGCARARLGVGQARVEQGLYEEGIRELESAVERLSTLGDSHCEAESWWLLGRAYGATGRAEAGEDLVERGLETVTRIGDRDDMTRMLIDLAQLQRLLGELDDAEDNAREAESIAAELDNPECVAAALAERSEVERSRGAFGEAVCLARAAHAAIEGLPSAGAWQIDLCLARALADDGGSAEAQIEALERATKALLAMRDQLASDDADRRAAMTRTRSRAVLRLSDLLEEAGRDREARSLRRDWGLGGESDATLDASDAPARS
ncbi:MAG: AAA family ATPase [Acidobacteriota bacterium]